MTNHGVKAIIGDIGDTPHMTLNQAEVITKFIEDNRCSSRGVRSEETLTQIITAAASL